MDKNAIKKYAVWARRELISRVSQRALLYGVSEKDCGDNNADTVNGHLLTSAEKKQRQNLISRIRQIGYEQTMEEAAYTWFNRFSALRFMEVNGYLPSHVRVFTDEQNAFKPQILAEAIHLDIDGLDMEKVYALKDANKTDELYKYLLVVQCNALGAILPGMFTRIEDYTELLFPDNLLREGSVIEQMISMIPEKDWNINTLDENGQPQGQVQIIGWLYQYYNAEPKDKVFENLKKNIKISKENIPAATQLFTPDWIVRYMVENSLGRLWVEGHPNDGLKANWKYYLEEAEQEPEVQAQLAEIRKEYAALKPEEIKVIDPCMGSGHILVYMFDVLVQIYESYGYNARETAGLILQNNLYGLDIDDRAAQLAYFAVMMKVRQYDRRIFSRGIQPHVYAIVESNGITQDTLETFANGNAELKKAIETIVAELHDAKEYGSILNVTPVDFASLYARLDEIKEDISLFATAAQRELRPLIEVAEVLAQKYFAVATNPPYMGASGMSAKLSDFIKKNYPDSKSDLFAVCIERGNNWVVKNGYNCMVTMQSWMFLSSFEAMRTKILASRAITNLMHMENMVMGIAFGTAVTVFRNTVLPKFKGTYNHITMADIEDERPKEFPIRGNRFAQVSTDNFSKIPGSPVAYWVNEQFIKSFTYKKMGEIAKPRQGLATSDNNRFIRLWFEIARNKACFTATSSEKAMLSGMKWFPYNKGGYFRRWYGNNEYVINWEEDGREVKDYAISLYKCVTRTIKNIPFYYRECISWSLISSGRIAFRYKPFGHIFDVSGMSCFSDNLLEYLLALCNSPVVDAYLAVFSPTINYQAGDIANIPIIVSQAHKPMINGISQINIEMSKKDWDSFETSWDFKRHPLLPHLQLGNECVFIDQNGKMGSLTNCTTTVACEYHIWEEEAEKRFNQLKANEEELNRIFIDIYGLRDELTPEVEDKDVTVRKADLQRDIRSLISYAVGCMFGRYSLDCEGLAYAGGEWENVFKRNHLTDEAGNAITFGGIKIAINKEYQIKTENGWKDCTYSPDADNIIPICDDDYFDDDITGKFIQWVETVYGKETLEENLRFIADALGGKGTPRDAIRSYFLNDFYADHLKIYQKRPIYWLFDSGKKNGFKALIYMHRYQPDTIARIRTDYVHEQQARYRTAITDLENRIAGASTSERVKLNKQLDKLQAQADEIHVYEEKIHHLADMMIPIDLDDGVKANYAKFEDVLAKMK